MKILFICAGWGSWIKPLIKQLETIDGVEVFAIHTYQDYSADVNGKVFYLNLKKNELQGNLTERTFKKYEIVIRKICPDIIQVYGTENNFGQLARYVKNIPVVVNLQGILTCYKYFRDSYLDTRMIKKYKSLKNYLGFGGFILNRQVRLNEKPEIDILQNNRYFFGRTKWDYNIIHLLNKGARYYQGEELLRESFYDNAGSWDISKIERHSIFMPAGLNPIKGLHLAIDALHLLIRDYPNIKLYVPGLESKFIYGSNAWRYFRGEQYTNYIAHLIIEYDLEQHIIPTGRLSGEEMMRYMQRSHLFLSPSVIDNSPNAVGEATMVGIPVVSTYVGGVPSFLKDGKSCLFANSGDPYMIAAAIGRVFEDDDLALTLSANALNIAKKRHNRVEVARQYVTSYEDIISDFFNKKNESIVI